MIEGTGKATGERRSGTFSVVDGAWQGQAAEILSGTGPTLRITPGWHAGDPDWRRQRARLLYFNLHGFRTKGTWEGFNPRTGAWKVGLRPGDVTRQESEGALVFAENCYGAWIEGKSSRNSVALSFLAAGVQAFVGATGLAFGNFLAPVASRLLNNADALAKGFVTSLGEGKSAGLSLVDARKAFVERGLETTYGQKTALQFVLLGNPLATL